MALRCSPTVAGWVRPLVPGQSQTGGTCLASSGQTEIRKPNFLKET